MITFVTGGAGGLGSSIARTLAGCGHTVVLNYNSSEEHARQIQSEIGENCHIVKGDVSRMSDSAVMAQFVSGKFGRLDNLICSAAITRDALLARYTESDWDLVIETNLKSCFHCVKAFVPLMRSSGGGHVIFISSYSGLKGSAGQAAYSASKAAIIGFGKSAAAEFAIDNVRVNTLIPGYMDTAMGRSSAKAMEKALRESLLNRLSDPDEVSRFIVFLCSTRNITGQAFMLESRIL